MQSFAEAPLAIVGMACRLPGADNLEEFWRLLVEGRTNLGELPADRFDRELNYDPRKGIRTKSYTSLGGAVSDKPFDTQSFPLPQELLERSHKAHLALLDTAISACRHAGMDPQNLPNRNVGVYVGHTPPTAQISKVVYARQVAHTAQFLRDVPGFDELTAGQQDAVIQEMISTVRSEFDANDKRLSLCASAYHAPALISKAMNLSGPSMTFDAACASSMRALGSAARALQRGQIDMAIIGSASYCSADTLVLFSAAQSVSPTGSRPFDENADGLVASEGYIVLVVKTLENAIADGDPIQAVIRGIGISSDGKGKSLWAPRHEGQIEAIKRAYHGDAKPSDLQFIEMHATSTQVGDATELTALTLAMSEHIPPGQKLPIGSVKANVGHSLETAGLASMVKTVLAMQHGMIPPQINIGNLNSKIEWDKIPFFVPRQPTPWPSPAPGQPRHAAVNAFGIGGLNVHVVLDEFAPVTRKIDVTNSGTPAGKDDAIAVIGMGSIFPGAHTIDALWDVLASGIDQKSDVPAERWDPNIGCVPGTDALWTVPTRTGGFIRDYQYDWKKHKVPPKQIENADPLQFMLLDAADQALRNAGYGDKLKPIDKNRTGVFVGTIFGAEFGDTLAVGLRLPDFQKTLGEVLSRRGIPEERIAEAAAKYEDALLKHMPALIDETGSFTASTLASRITKTFDLMGGAVAVDAGDASSFAALNCSIDVLLAGDCDMMICAAGHRSMSFAAFEAMARTGLLTKSSPHGPFAQNADGCVPGEGVGVVVLKRLSDAERDGDTIHAVIRGIGAAYDPSLEQGIKTAMERAFASSNVRPEDVVVVEAGAKGLRDYDRQEAAAIASVYGAASREQPIRLGAAAGQFGNTGGASGMLSLMKAVSELNHAEAVPNVGIEQPLPELTGAGAVQLPPARTKLVSSRDDGRLIAGVSSISQYQLAYHVLVEGATRVPRATTPSKSQPTATKPVAAAVPAATVSTWRIVRVGAQSWPELIENTSKLAGTAAAAFAGAESQAFTATDRVRLAIVASDANDLATKAQLAAKQVQNREARGLLAEKGIFAGELGASRPKVAFLFPGQGSQYTGMLRSLVSEYEPAADVLRQIDAVLARLGLGTFDELAWSSGDELGKDVWRTQLSILIADTIAAAAVAALGLKPDRVAGHSFGELAALVAAGAWSFEQALVATSGRCQSIDACPGARGVMLMTAAPAETVTRLVGEIGGALYVSHFNSPDQTVVGGEEGPVARLNEAITALGFQTKTLAVPAAFHTPLMEPVKPAFAKALDAIALEPPRIPLLSSVTNRYVSDPVEIRANLVAQMTQPVDWTGLTNTLADEGVSVFVEVGPRQVLTGLHKSILGDRPAAVVGINHPKRGGLQQLLAARACVEVTGALDPATSSLPFEIASSTAGDAVPEAVSQKAEVALSQASVEPGIIPEYRELNVLRLAGTPYEMGYQHGRAHAEAIRRVLRRYADLAGSKWDQVRQVDSALSHPETFFSAEELEELRGIAKGADVTVAAVIAHNLRLFLDAGSGGLHFAVTAATNPGDGLLHAVNEDIRLALCVKDCLERNIQVRHPAGKLPYVAFCVAGQVGTLNGINAAGLAVSTSALLDVPQSATGLTGPLQTVVVKQILESAETVDAAIELLRKVRGSIAWAVCLSHHASDRIAYVEYDGKAMRVQAAPPAVVAANHRVMESFAGAEVPPHSQHRLNRLKELLGGEKPTGLSVSRVQQALRDHFDPVRQRESSTPTMNTVRRVDNQISIVMQPGQGTIWVTGGPMANGHQNEFARLKIDELLKIEMPRPASAPAATSTAASAADSTVISQRGLIDALHRAEQSGENGVCTRYVMRVVEAPALPAVSQLPLHGAAIVVGQNAAAKALTARLQSFGATVYELPSAGDIDATLTAIDTIWQATPAPHLFLMTAHDEDAVTSLEAASWSRRRTQGVMLPYFVTQRWYTLAAKAGLLNQATVFAATALGGDFGFSSRVRGAEGGALAGLMKGLKLELEMTGGVPSFHAKVIDFAADVAAADVAEQLCREMATDDREVEIAYAAGKRYHVRPVVESIKYAPKEKIDLNRLQPGGVCVITGGARGVTAVVARELGKRYGLKLHLIGSSPLPEIPDAYLNLNEAELKEVKASVMKDALGAGQKPADAWARFEKAIEIAKTLKSFADAGLKTTYHACDVSNRDALAAVLAQIRAADGPISGVIHGAGFERACRFDKKTRDNVDRTIAAKVDGAAALIELTANDPVAYFAAFGSVSGRFGGVGQTDYCVANEMVSKLVDWYRTARPECHAAAFHWHAWDDVGMAVRPESQHIRKLHNIQFMPSMEGADHLINELAIGLPEGEIVITELKYYREKYGSAEAQAPAASPIDELPLIDALTVAEPGRSIVGEMHLKPAGDVFLTQHRYKGRPMLPVVVGMESLLETASLLAGGKQIVGLKNIEILNGMRFSTDEPLTARVKASLNGSEVACELIADLANRAGKILQKDRQYLRGTVELADAPRTFDITPPADPGNWHNCWYPEEDIVIYHGPPFRCLREMTVVDEKTAVARLVAPDITELGGSRTGSSWVTPAALLDACFFASGIALWVMFKGVVAIPNGIRHIRLGRLPQAGELCTVQIVYRGREDKLGLFDLTLFGSDGTVILAVDGYQNVIVAEEPLHVA